MRTQLLRCDMIFICLLVMGIPLQAAPPADLALGKLVLNGKTYTLKHGVVYKAKVFEDSMTNVVLSDRPISVEKLKQSLDKGGTDDDFYLFQPHVKVAFDERGQAAFSNSWADNASLSVSGSRLTGRLTIKDGRVEGRAQLSAKEESARGNASFEIHFDLVPISAKPTAEKREVAAPPKVRTSRAEAKKSLASGKLSLNGKSYDLKHGLSYKAKFFDDVKTNVVLSGRPVPVDELKKSLSKDGTDDAFFLFEPHVKVSFDEQGVPDFSISWADNTTQSVSGSRLTGHLTTMHGRVRGQAQLTAKEDGGQATGSFEIKFDLALLANRPSAEKPRDVVEKIDVAKQKPSSKPEAGSASSLNVYSLPMPENASNVQFKMIVKQISYKSATTAPKVADFLVKNLESQGWKVEGSDLRTPKSSILKRSKGTASLTLFVRADGTGSSVVVMSKGLSWEKAK